MSWTTPQDVIESWVGPDAPDDLMRIQAWIDRAERLVRRNVKDLQDRIDAEAELVPPSKELLNTAKDVVIEMVTEVFRNPEGIRSIQQTTGAFSGSTTFGGDNPGKLTFTNQHSAMLSSIAPGEAFTIDLIAGPYL